MKMEKILKLLGEDTVQELNEMDSAKLSDRIVVSEQSIKQAKEELEANPNFQRIKEDLKALTAGMREVKKRQNAIIEYALTRLEELGK